MSSPYGRNYFNFKLTPYSGGKIVSIATIAAREGINIFALTSVCVVNANECMCVSEFVSFAIVVAVVVN